MAPKLHEVLAVEKTLKGQADKTRTELGATFEKKQHLFGSKIITFKSNEEGKPPVTEEQSDLQTTVNKELAWLKPILARALDASYQIALGNMTAKADIVLEGGQVIAKDVPVTALLELEKRAGEVQNLVQQIKTLDPAKGFKLDPDKGDNIYVARDVTKTRTKKTQKPLQMAKATDKHAEQVQLIAVDEPVGTIQEQEWSGLLTTADKADMIDRAEKLRRAIQQARARANQTEVADSKIGTQLLDYVFTASK